MVKGISRGLAIAALVGTGTFVGSLTSAHAAGANLTVGAVPYQTCPTAATSNGKIIISKTTHKPAYHPTSLTGSASTTTAPVASVCIKNVTKATQTMTGPSCANFAVPAGQTIALDGPAGTYKCGLSGSKSVLTVTIH